MSTVIKKGEQGTLLRQLVNFDLADHLGEAHQVVAAARREAQRIVAQATNESTRLRAEARTGGHREGYELGHALGLEQGRTQGLAEAMERFNADHAALARSMAAVIEDVERRKEGLLIQASRDVLEFAVAVAQAVTRRMAQLDGQAARANVEAALRLVGDRTHLSVRIHPRDAETLRHFGAELSGQPGDGQDLSIVEDESIGRGGAVVTCGDMEVDARIETQLAQITDLLLGSQK